ncbi:MAG TPA: HAMP domain-containing sensor histidine kinase [Acidimicrobiales bacterium]|nr:HAMP domain-containing sensor histidine kinase [Acidimicrobiales bacterium]
MRARITIAVVATLALALAIAGVVSILLLRSAARTSARQTVLRQTHALVQSTSTGRLKQLLENDQSISSEELLKQVLQLVQLVTTATPSPLLVSSNGQLFGQEPGPALSSAQLHVLLHCGTVSGLQGDTAYAAVPLDCYLATLGGTGSTSSSPSNIATIAIALSEPITYSDDSVWYFLLAAAVALVVAGIVAALIARRVSRHVVAAAGAAQAIADGDLDVRVSARDRGYRELVALGASINTMASGLARARALERQFLLSISHDLRTPLTSIRGYAEAIADGIAADPQEAARVVMAEGARLERLIRDLLDLAYLDAKRFSLHPEQLDLGEAVASAAEALRYELETSAVTLEVSRPDEPLVVSADAHRLSQIVANLVENAGKYARTRVVVTLERQARDGESVRSGELRPGEGGVAVSVEDDGQGIAAEDLPHIFERLFTSEKAPSRAARGTGLGLAIVAELAGAMGGAVRAESPVGPDGGTRMTVWLPLRAPSVPAGSARSVWSISV